MRELIDRHAEPALFGFLGEPRVHVLRLNLALETSGAR
ncbi:MAG: potassium-transporting ATPase subunit C [Burkholderiales bacterium]|nr:potassium-transporting ATPase subunit C [Burkholderiales bacterium]